MAKQDYHQDGSRTDRYEDGTSITYNSDGTVREQTTPESSNPFSLVPIIGGMCEKDMSVTRDGEGHILHAEYKK